MPNHTAPTPRIQSVGYRCQCGAVFTREGDLVAHIDCARAEGSLTKHADLTVMVPRPMSHPDNAAAPVSKYTGWKLDQLQRREAANELSGVRASLVYVSKMLDTSSAVCGHCGGARHVAYPERQLHTELQAVIRKLKRWEQDLLRATTNG